MHEEKAKLEQLENARSTALLQRKAVGSDDEGIAEGSSGVEGNEEDYIEED